VDPARSSVQYGTKLGAPNMGQWTFVLYPDAAEGGGSFRSAARSSGGGYSVEPAADSRPTAARRARGKVRRYCAANRLNRLGTLTYAGAGCHDPAQFREDLAGFFKRLRASTGERFPYLWVPEWHKSGHGLHAHFAVGRYIQRGLIDAAWGRGFVHIKLLGDLPVGSAALGEARLAARYLSKYVGKDLGQGEAAGLHLGQGEAAGLHRYEVAQGFQPRNWPLDGTSADEVLRWAEACMGAAPEYVWRSRDTEEWAGPPAVWASWA
jgi:hypothetical protein